METNNIKPDFWEQAAQYLAGELNESEKANFEILINTDKEHKQLFEEIKTDWNFMEIKKKNRKPDVNKAWQNLQQRLETENLIPQQTNQSKGKVIQFKQVLSIAAILTIGLLISVFAYLKISQTEQYITVATLNETKNVTLADGSIIYLNENSTLKYSEKFGKQNRNVILTGEAFFEIKRDTANPFTIEADKTQIRVLGTSFNVNTRNNVEVNVKTGKVQFSAIENNNKIILVAGEKGLFEKNTITKELSKNQNYLAWKTRILNFDGEKLSEVVEKVNEIYKTNIIFASTKTGNYILGKTTFENLPAETIIQLICESFELKAIYEHNNIILHEKTE